MCDSLRFWGTIIILIADALLIVLFHVAVKFPKFRNLPFFLYPNYIMAIGVFAALFHFFGSSVSEVSLASIADALVATVKVFGFDILINDLENYGYYNELKDAVADFRLLNALRLFAPIITLRAALSIFRDYLTQIKYFFSFFRKAHIFSELNEKSICLATDIYNKSVFLKPIIIFENIDSDLEENDEGLTLQCKSIGALFTKKHILDFHFLRLNFSPTSIYLIDNNSHENLNNATKLFEIYKYHKYDFYVFTTDVNSEFFIDALDKSDAKATIHLISQPQIISYNLMINKPLFTGADNNNSGKISLLVIGAGNIGMECVKTAMWCSRMNTYDFEIRIIDSCDRFKEFEKENFRFENDIRKAGINLNYKFIQVDINSPDFIKCLHSYANYNYIIIATGNDELTINTALKTKTEIIRKRVNNNAYTFNNLPVIVPIILNDNYFELFNDFVNNREDAKIFFPCGVNSEVFTLNNIQNWFVDEIAMAFYNIYNNLPINMRNIDYYNIKECDKRSNRAAAVHSIYKLKDLGINVVTEDVVVSDEKSFLRKIFSGSKDSITTKRFNITISEYQLNKVNKRFNDYDSIIKMLNKEHERWTIFSVLDGWSNWTIDQINSISVDERSPENKKIHKLNEGRLHGCITTKDGLLMLNSIFRDLDVNKKVAKSPESENDRTQKQNKKKKKVKTISRTLELEKEKLKANKENIERDNVLSRFNISNTFFKNDFKVCWVSNDIIYNRFNRHFVVEKSIKRNNDYSSSL